MSVSLLRHKGLLGCRQAATPGRARWDTAARTTRRRASDVGLDSVAGLHTPAASASVQVRLLPAGRGGRSRAAGRRTGAAGTTTRSPWRSTARTGPPASRPAACDPDASYAGPDAVAKTVTRQLQERCGHPGLGCLYLRLRRHGAQHHRHTRGPGARSQRLVHPSGHFHVPGLRQRVRPRFLQQGHLLGPGRQHRFAQGQLYRQRRQRHQQDDLVQVRRHSAGPGQAVRRPGEQVDRHQLGAAERWRHLLADARLLPRALPPRWSTPVGRTTSWTAAC